MYYRGAAAAIVVFDITNQDSFQKAKQWVKELQRQGNTNIVIALAGNKYDLEDKRKVDTSEAQSYADDNGILYMETSAKTAHNVSEIFVAIAKKLPKDPIGQKSPDDVSTVLLKPGDGNEPKPSVGCCGGK